jgi:hypothetical protein
MYDAGKILLFLLVMVGVTTAPVWYNAARGRGTAPPKLAVGTTEKDCVLPVAEMRAAHMQVLDDWRTRVVRGGEHVTRTSQGREVRMSLTGTCLGCHAQKTEFCDKCHDYAAVKLACFDCHLAPKSRRP